VINTNLTRSVKRFHKDFGLLRQNQSKDLWLCMMMEELGELTHAVLRDQPKEEIEGELGDLLYLMEGFCQLFGYDLSAGAEQTIRKNDGKKPRQFGAPDGKKVLRKAASRRPGWKSGPSGPR
jgi:NTP pyrophosphatase (non-canonical NTP hydrolase)